MMAKVGLLLGLLLNAATLFAQDSLNVTRLGSLIVDGYGNICDFALSEDYLYATSCTNKTLRIVDVSDPQAPTITGILESDYFISGVAKFENYVYLADITRRLLVVDVSDPASPVQVAVVTLLNGSRNVRVFGSRAYVFDDILTILDLADPLQPVVLGTYGSPDFGWEHFVRDIEIVGDYAYLLGPTWLRVVDTSNPALPEEVGVYRTAYEAYNMAISGTRVYVNEFTSGMEVIDVSDPSAPALLGTLEFDDDIDARIRNFAASGDYLFTANDEDKMHVFNVADPIHAQHVGWHSTERSGTDVLLAGSIVYVCDYWRAEIFDISAATPVGESLYPLVSEFSLHPIYPNPFNNTANIRFDLPREVTGRLVVYDVLGRMTNTLYDGKLAAGTHNMQFNGNGLSSGIYFIKLVTPNYNATQKATLLK